MEIEDNLPDRISDWMKQKVESAGARGVVLGLSGGIDSAVVAALAKRAFGEHVLGVIMPCDSLPLDTEHGLLTAQALEIECITVDLTDTWCNLTSKLPDAPPAAAGNLKPRLRMAALYYLAACRNYLVAGTGNKSELMVGYFTKHGDGGSDLLPIGGLYKSQVRQLAKLLNIPAAIVEKAPSAGLWEGQTDEADIGVPYETLDVILAALESKSGLAKFDLPIVERVRKLVTATAHKRCLPPVFRP